MKIISTVQFVLEMIDPSEYKYTANVRNLQETINKIDCVGLTNKVPCAFNLMRKVAFRTEKYCQLLTPNGEDITTDSFKFIVANKVPYVADLQQYLLENSRNSATTCQDVHFKNMTQFDTKKPIFFTGPYEYNGSFLPDAPLEKRPLTARPLTYQDIVLDKKLNQIWPVVAKQPPKELIALLAKTTEKIYEG